MTILFYETITDYWKDTGTPEDILNANRQVLEHICKQGCIVDESSKEFNQLVLHRTIYNW